MAVFMAVYQVKNGARGHQVRCGKLSSFRLKRDSAILLCTLHLQQVHRRQVIMLIHRWEIPMITTRVISVLLAQVVVSEALKTKACVRLSPLRKPLVDATSFEVNKNLIMLPFSLRYTNPPRRLAVRRQRASTFLRCS